MCSSDLVEVVRGAGSGPYGAGALTGVVALSERTGASGVVNMEGGEIGEWRTAGSGNVQFGRYSLGASAMYTTSGGWVPTDEAHRGPADTPLSLRASSASIHVSSDQTRPPRQACRETHQYWCARGFLRSFKVPSRSWEVPGSRCP